MVTLAAEALQDADADSVPTRVAAPPIADPYIGCTIDNRYKVESAIGEGGMGVVYRCQHTVLGRTVAIKVLRADLARDSELTERFLNEARAATAIGNPHIIDISDFGRLPDSSTYFVMEFLAGTPLAEEITKGTPMPVPRLLHVAQQIAEGLAAAHNAGIVHRDLKPDNIVLVKRGPEPDFVKILDFGIAKVTTSAEGRLTRAGAVFGTPHYMSPEQAAGSPVDARGDIYSLGIILYELASARVPFDADNIMGILTQHMYKAPASLREAEAPPQEISPGLEAVILKCLSKSPEQRYQTMAELGDELQRVIDGEIPDAVQEMMERSADFNVPPDYFDNKQALASVSVSVSVPPQESKWRWAWYFGVAALVGLSAAFAAYSSRQNEASKRGDSANGPFRPEQLRRGANGIQIVEAADLPVTRRVNVAVEPILARIIVDGTDIGESPQLVDVNQGESVQVAIRYPGYHSKKLTLDGTKARISVRLKKIPRKRQPPKPAAKSPRRKPVAKAKARRKAAARKPRKTNGPSNALLRDPEY